MQRHGCPTAPLPPQAGPLPRSWMQSQAALGANITQRYRDLGITGQVSSHTPVPCQVPLLRFTQNALPAESSCRAFKAMSLGLSPPSWATTTLRRLVAPHPLLCLFIFTQHIHDLQGVGQGNGTGWMDSTDPAFGRIADAWMAGILDAFGKTGSWYQMDGFFHNGTSWGEALTGTRASFVAGEACVWSSQLGNTYLAGCDSARGCAAFASLVDAKEACVSSRTCFGVTAHVNGSFELRGSDVPMASPTNETSFVIVNVGTCHAPPPDPQWAARGSAAYAPLARADPDAVWSYQGYALEVGGGPGPPSAGALARLRGFVDGAPPGRFVIGECSAVRNRPRAFGPRSPTSAPWQLT